jgi:glycosyltransferase involved in cell wall biosynthesis
LLERIKIEESKVHVVHLAAELDESLSHGDEAVPPQPYYLYVGARPGYKNFPTLLKAFAEASSQRPELSLCVVGSSFKLDEHELMNRLKIADRVQCFGQASDRQLAKLYRCSLALVYPSLYEGFGIPALEAMACGTVAVVGNTSSLPEVVGDAGVMFDPKSPAELADVLVWLIDHPEEREILISKGHERAKNFSWDKTAAETVKIYRSLKD